MLVPNVKILYSIAIHILLCWHKMHLEYNAVYCIAYVSVICIIESYMVENLILDTIFYIRLEIGQTMHIIGIFRRLLVQSLEYYTF